MAEITLLDGGMGQEIIHRAGDRPTPLWSTQVLNDMPGLVAGVHRDYFAAGATIATTVTYPILRDRLVDSPLAGQFEKLIDKALGEAEAARTEGGRIAGSIGPLAATYRPDIHPEYDRAVPAYAEIADLIGPRVDLIICETVASHLHARAILEGAKAASRPVWLSITVSDTDGTKLRSGEPVADIVGIAHAGGAEAILINCSAPEAVKDGLAALGDSPLPLGAYANGFVKITEAFLGAKPTADTLQAREDVTPARYADFALDWITQGATIVGGCCEVGPAHIAELKSRLLAEGHRIV